jgi:flagellar hook-associated protein 1 FlgK
MGQDALEIGRSGLVSAQKSLHTTAHNLANVNTEGFSRQRTKQVTNRTVEDGPMTYGTGSQAVAIERIHDGRVEKQLGKSISEFNFHQSRLEFLSQMESVFNESSLNGLSQNLVQFFNSFRELSSNPENETLRSIVRESARFLIHDIKQKHDSLDIFLDGLDYKVGQTVEDINQLLSDVAAINAKLRSVESAGDGVNGDMRDKRDMAVRSLSEFFQVQTYTDDKGNYVVTAEGVGTLVAGAMYQKMIPGTTTQKELGRGQREIFMASKPNRPITELFSQGKVQALSDTRGSEAKLMMGMLDELAWDLTQSVNAIHLKGYTYPRQSPFAKNQNPIIEGRTEVAFFKPLTQKEGAAVSMDLSTDVQNSLENIALALEPQSPGDNRVGLGISRLFDTKFAKDGSRTLEENIIDAIGILGLSINKANLNKEQAEGIMTQMKSIRERISGVSIDEETSNMMRYQQAYEASARVIRVAEEMLRELLSIKR